MLIKPLILLVKMQMAEGVGFEPTLGFPLSLISSQVHSTTLPPFHTLITQVNNGNYYGRMIDSGKIIRERHGLLAFGDRPGSGE